MLKGTLPVLLLVLALVLEVHAAPAANGLTVTRSRVTRGPNAVVLFKPGTTNQLARLSLEGLPLREAVEMLRSAFPHVNFVVSKSAETEPVSVQLKNVDLDGALRGMALATAGRLLFNLEDPRLIQITTPATVRPVGDAELRVFNLGGYLGERNGEEAAAALAELEEVVDLSLDALRTIRGEAREESGKRPAFSRYHRGTRLLIVAGPPDVVRIYETVITELTRNPRTPDAADSE